MKLSYTLEKVKFERDHFYKPFDYDFNWICFWPYSLTLKIHYWQKNLLKRLFLGFY